MASPEFFFKIPNLPRGLYFRVREYVQTAGMEWRDFAILAFTEYLDRRGSSTPSPPPPLLIPEGKWVVTRVEKEYLLVRGRGAGALWEARVPMDSVLATYRVGDPVEGPGFPPPARTGARQVG